MSLKMPMPGIVTPATMGWNMVSSSCRPRKYQGALDGLGVRLGLAVPSRGAFTKAEKTRRKAVMAREATNSPTSRCGHTCTLSTGVALTSWIEPALTTVSSLWVWPAGPTGAAAPAPAVTWAVAVAVAVAARAGAGPPPPPAGSWAGSPPPGWPGGGASPPPAPPFWPDGAARRSAARLRRCSGTSVTALLSLLRLQRPGDAAVLADAPEVDGHEDHDHEREHEDVEDVPAQERLRAYLHPAQQGEADLLAEHRGVAHHVRPHRHRPQGQLVPRQQVAGEREQQGERQQDDADDPVELPWRFVGAVVEDPGHVQEHRQHHQVGGPAVHVPHQEAEGHRRLERLDVVPGLGRGGPVEEHQEDPGHRQDDEQEERQSSQAERVADLDRVTLHLHRMKVVQHAVHDHVGPVAGAVRVSLAEDRPGPEDRRPDLRPLDALREL